MLIPGTKGLGRAVIKAWRHIAIAVVGLGMYLGLAGLGFEMEDVSLGTPLLWPPAGFGLTFVLWAGLRQLPTIAIAVFIVSLYEHGSPGFGLLSAGATAIALGVAVILFRRFGFRAGMERLEDVALFAAVGLGAGSGLSSLGNAIVQSWLTVGSLDHFWVQWGVRWMSEALGMIMLTPFLLVWESKTRISWHNRQSVELLIWLSVLITMGGMVFRYWAPTDTLRYPLELAMFPILAWAAVRFGQRGVTTGIVIVTLMAIWELQDVVGPDATRTITQAPGYLWAFVGILSGTSIAMGAVVSEHVNREDSIQRNEARLRAFIDAMPDVAYVISDSGVFQDVFASATGPYRATAHALKGRLIDEVYGPEVAHEMRATITRALRTGRTELLEYPLSRDQDRWFEGRVCPMRSLNGDARSVIWAAYEITDRRFAEDRLRLAKEEADAANLAKSEFLAIMSHEIRTPMNAILGFAELMEQTELNADQREYVRIVTRSGRDLLDLINNILDYSKIESRAITLETAAFHLEEVLIEALELVVVKAKQKGIDLGYSMKDASGGRFLGDSLRLRQILLNLVSNAVKFTRAGKVSVDVQTRQLDESLWEVSIAVNDTGIGIPPEKLGRLFQPFSQVDSSTTREYGGTGLGLIISKRLAEKMRGDIRVQSSLNRGSTFTVTVVLPEAVGQQLQFEQPMDNTADRAFSTKYPSRILVAEDDPVGRDLILESLERIGYTPDVLASGHEALGRLSREAYDVVFVGCRMADMDGIEVTRKVRRGDCGPAASSAYIIGVTALALSENREKCISAGMNEYVSKPMALSVLKSSLARASIARQSRRLG